jgi:DNA-binding NtrC family response regulator
VAAKLIYVVDDEAPLLDAVAAFLKSRGLVVIPFTSPLQALASAISIKPDLLLSDFSMEEMDGLTFAAKLRELHPVCKVLMMSGAIHEADRHPRHNEFEFLQKPLQLRQLLLKINSALEET